MNSAMRLPTLGLCSYLCCQEICNPKRLSSPPRSDVCLLWELVSAVQSVLFPLAPDCPLGCLSPMTVTAQKYIAFNGVEKSEGIAWSL